MVDYRFCSILRNSDSLNRQKVKGRSSSVSLMMPIGRVECQRNDASLLQVLMYPHMKFVLSILVRLLYDIPGRITSGDTWGRGPTCRDFLVVWVSFACVVLVPYFWRLSWLRYDVAMLDNAEWSHGTSTRYGAISTTPWSLFLVINVSDVNGFRRGLTDSFRFGIQYVNYTTLERVYKRSAIALCKCTLSLSVHMC